MQTTEVKLPSIEVIRKFVNVVNSLDADVDLGSGATIVDAKSILGVFALANASTKNIKLTIHSEDKNTLRTLEPFMA